MINKINMTDVGYVISICLLPVFAFSLLYLMYIKLKLTGYLRKNYPETAKKMVYFLIPYSSVKKDLKLDKYAEKIYKRGFLSSLILLISGLGFIASLNFSYDVDISSLPIGWSFVIVIIIAGVLISIRKKK